MEIEIKTSKQNLVVKDIPETSWEELKPYWPSIVKSIIEVFLEGDFKPYSVRKNREDGFYAAEWYWEKSSFNPREYQLKEAKKFLKMLLKKKDFIGTIKEFNKSKNVEWTSKKNIKRLRQFVYSVCFELEEFLRSFHNENL